MSATDIGRSKPQRPLKPISKAGNGRTYPTTRSILALILREMGARFGNSPGGFFWALISPLIMILVLTAAFSLVQRSPRIGDSFMMYYASGHLVFGIYSQLFGPIASALQFNSSLLNFPTVTWLDAIFARFILNAMIGVFVFFVVLHGIAYFTGTPMRFDYFKIFEAVAYATIVALSWGTLACYVFMEVPMIKQIWRFFSRPLFIASGVLFMYEDFPPLVQDILYWNPLLHVVALAREGIFEQYTADWVNPLYVGAFCIVTLSLGLLFVRQHHSRLLGDEE